MSHDRCLNNNTQLAVELSFEYADNFCLQNPKARNKQTVSRSGQDRVNNFHHVSPTQCTGKNEWTDYLRTPKQMIEGKLGKKIRI